MKINKNILLAAITLCFSSAATAQTDDVPAAEAGTQNTDSLLQTVQALSQEVSQLRKGNANEMEALKRQQKIWKKSNPLMLSIGSQTLTEVEAGTKYKSNLAVSLSKLRTYYLHSKPIADMIKFGLDVSWFDISYARYEKGKGINGALSNLTGTVTDGTYNDMDDYFNHAYGSASSYTDDDVNIDMAWDRINLGKHSLTYNMGIGPSIKVVPFYALNKAALDPIKASLYFHWLPGATGIIFTGDDINASYGALLKHYAFGFNLSYGRFGIGVEHRWGSAKLNNWQADDDEEYEESSSSDRIEYKLASTRFYIGIRF